VRTLVAVLLAALLAACAPQATGNPNVAATVNGEDIPVEAVQRRYDSAKANPQLAAQLDADPAIRADVQAQILTGLIRSQLLEQGAAEIGVSVTDADVAQTREDIIEEVGGPDAFEAIVEQSGLSEPEIDEQLREIALRERVEAALGDDIDVTDADVRAYYEQVRDTRYERLRARHILVETEEEAAEALDRLDAGEDFAAVAEDVSIDPGSGPAGGDLGEFSRGRMVPEFEEAAFAAEIGEVVGPVETQFGFHIIEVTERVSESFGEVADDLHDELVEQQRGDAVGAWLAEQTRQADVQVNPRFGAWDEERGEVVPTDPLGEGPQQPQQAPDPEIELEIEQE
jgi:parvulin-like peptidyl-prolyl isomerase